MSKASLPDQPGLHFFCAVCLDRGCSHCPDMSTESIARRAAKKVAFADGDLSILEGRELSALAAVLLCRLDGDGRVAA